MQNWIKWVKVVGDVVAQNLIIRAFIKTRPLSTGVPRYLWYMRPAIFDREY